MPAEHDGPFPHADCLLAFRKIIDEMAEKQEAMMRSAIADAITPLVKEVNGHSNDLYGNGKPGLKQIVQDLKTQNDELRREREAEKEFRRRLASLVWGNIVTLSVAIASLIIGCWMVWRHINDHEIHTRMIVQGNRPIMVNERDEKGNVVGQLWVWPKNGADAAGAAHP